MAHALEAAHDEQPATSPLFTGFLLLSVGWLALGAVTGFPAEAAPDIDPGPSIATPLD